MSKGFVIEFSVDVADGVERFRVRIADDDREGPEPVRVFRATEGPFGEVAWEPERQAERLLMIALAFDGYLRADPRVHSELANGLTLIDIGTIKREA